jgi:hypothetical protein
MKNFNGRPIFSLFFIARANQKIPNLAVGRQSTVTINELCHDSRVCFLLFLLLFLRQLSSCFYVIMARSTSCLLTCLLLYVVRTFILFLLTSVLVFCCL